MEMTVDTAIKTLEHYNHGFCESSGGLSEPIKVAINIMHKYQKIAEIMSVLNGNFYGSYLKDRQALEKIYEVVEDGNNNQHN